MPGHRNVPATSTIQFGLFDFEEKNLVPRIALMGITRGIKLPKPLLLNRPSELYVRFFVPVDLQKRVGCRYLIRSLHGQRADAARLMAAALGYALSNALERLRMDTMTDPKGMLDTVLAGVKKVVKRFTTYNSRTAHASPQMAVPPNMSMFEKPSQIWKKQVRSPLLHQLPSLTQKLDCCLSASKNF